MFMCDMMCTFHRFSNSRPPLSMARKTMWMQGSVALRYERILGLFRFWQKWSYVFLSPSLSSYQQLTQKLFATWAASCLRQACGNHVNILHTVDAGIGQECLACCDNLHQSAYPSYYSLPALKLYGYMTNKCIICKLQSFPLLFM